MTHVEEDLVSVGPSVVLVDAVEPLRELDEAHVLALDGVQEKAQGLQSGKSNRVSDTSPECASLENWFPSGNAPASWLRPHPRGRHKLSDQDVPECSIKC